MSEQHYYATCAFGWAVAPTRAQAIKDMSSYVGSDLIKRQVNSQKGLYCWSCRVMLPQEATYTVNEYMPYFITKDGKPTDKRVPIDRVIEGRVQNVKGHMVVEDHDEEDE